MRLTHFLLATALCGPAALAQAQVPQPQGGPVRTWGATSGAALARDYAHRGEFEKAVFLFEKLKGEEQTAPATFPDYLAALQSLKRWKDAEKLAKKAQRQHPEDGTIGVALGGVYQASGQAPAADKQWQRVLAQLTPAQVVLVATEFTRRELPAWAEKTYLRGRTLAKNEAEYAPQLIQLYTQTGQREQLLAETLRLVQQDEAQLPYVRNMLQNALREEKDFEALEKLLIAATQQHPEQAAYSELLLWLNVQRRDFAGALIQARALDRRGRSQGSRVLELAAIALQNKDYESAIEGYAYVVREYRGGPFFNPARQLLLQAREAQVRDTYPVDLAKVRALADEYNVLLTELGRTPEAAPLMRNLANLYAFQLDERPRAVALLEEITAMPRAPEEVVDQAKITLGDLYQLKGEPWEATLLYSQVEKSRKDAPLGYEAKLRNARLSYSAGDFKLAQSHLDILKEATTREIANDAMQLALLIQDNTVEDTLGLALKDYAAVEALVFQNKLPAALTGLDALLLKYPGHSLSDDAWYLKAQLQRRTGDFAAALTTLERITRNPKTDVLSTTRSFSRPAFWRKTSRTRPRPRPRTSRC